MRWKKTLAALVAISISGISYAESLAPGATTTFNTGDPIIAGDMNTNFNNIVTEVNDNDGRIDQNIINIGTNVTDISNIKSTIGGTFPRTPTLDTQIVSLENTRDNRTVVSLLDYPNIYPWIGNDGPGVALNDIPASSIASYNFTVNPVNLANDQDSGPGIQAAMQDAIDNHLVLEFPVGQIFWIKTPITLYVGSEHEVGPNADLEPLLDQQTFDIRGNNSELYVANWGTFNGPVITIKGRQLLAEMADPNKRVASAFSSSIRDLKIELNGHYNQDPHRDLYALQIGHPDYATSADGQLNIEGWRIKRRFTNNSQNSVLNNEKEGYFNNALIKVTNTNLFTIRDCNLVFGGIYIEGVNGYVSGSAWIHGNDIRGPMSGRGSTGGEMTWAPDINTNALIADRALTIYSSSGGQAASIYVSENQLYHASALIRADATSSIHNIHMSDNEFDIGVDSTPFVRVSIEPQPNNTAVHEAGIFFLRFTDNTFSAPSNSPIFLFEGGFSPNRLSGLPGIYGLSITSNSAILGNSYDPSVALTGSTQATVPSADGIPGLNTYGALVHMDDMVDTAVISDNTISKYGGYSWNTAVGDTVADTPPWTSLVSIQNNASNPQKKKYINVTNNIWEDSEREFWTQATTIGSLNGVFPSTAPASAVRLIDSIPHDLNLVVQGNNFPPNVPTLSYANIAQNLINGGRFVIEGNSTSSVITTTATAKVWVPDGAMMNLSSGSPIRNFVVGDGSSAPPAGHEFTVYASGTITINHEDTTNQDAGKISLIHGQNLIVPTGTVLKFISDGTVVREIGGTSQFAP